MELVFLLLVIGGAIAIYQSVQASRTETGESRTVRSLPPSVQHVVGAMDHASQNAFFNDYERRKKKKSFAWIAWFILGWHYLYVGKIGLQFAFWFTGGGFLIWWFVDLFRMPSIVRSANEQIARDTIQTLGAMAAFAAPAVPAQPQSPEYGQSNPAPVAESPRSQPEQPVPPEIARPARKQKFCAKCGGAFADNAAFCVGCGASRA